MTHQNRGRLVVNIGGNWRIYTNTIPAGSVPIGTVSRGDHDTGALVKLSETGLYAQINAGATRSLDERKVQAAIKRQP